MSNEQLSEMLMSVPQVPEHINWLVDTRERLSTVDGKEVEVWEFQHEENDTIMSGWARHFRNHYCYDNEIDDLREGTGLSRADYLNENKFPNRESNLGPSIRSGDFSEILVADFLEYLLGYWVPRTRYDLRTIRDESTKGSDIIGFYVIEEGETSPKDQLAIYEVKSHLSGREPQARLQCAICDSAKDPVRKGESLNAIKQRLVREGKEPKNVAKVARFQGGVDFPYIEIYGAAVLLERSLFSSDIISETNASSHPRPDNLALIVIRGDQMMKLVHDLYRRAADEA